MVDKTVSASAPAVAAAKPSPPPLTTAQIVARSEQSVALIKGKVSSGTGFLIRAGIIATNAHVIEHEFISELEVRFPSATRDQQGPYKLELLYEDSARDLAFLAVSSSLPPLDVAASYDFMRGEDIIVIGNPGLGDAVVLENAVTKGVMSSKAFIEGHNFHQLGIAINPGNSGGPVFDSAGRVIGVATLKSVSAEAIGFSIPIGDVQAALTKLDSLPAAAIARLASQRRAERAFKLLTLAGALYVFEVDLRRKLLTISTEERRALHALLTTLEELQFSLLDRQTSDIRGDTALDQTVRRELIELADNYQDLKDLHQNSLKLAHRLRLDVTSPAWRSQYPELIQNRKANHLRLAMDLSRLLKVEIPATLLAFFERRTAAGGPPELLVLVPTPMQPRFRREHPAAPPGGAPGPGSPSAPNRPRDRGDDSRPRKSSVVERPWVDVALAFRNPDFESARPLDGWEVVTQGPKATVALDDEIVLEGRHALRITAEAPSDTALVQELVLARDGSYLFTGWVKTKGIDPMGAKVFGTFRIENPEGGGVLAVGPNSQGDNDWKCVELSFRAPRSGRVRISAFVTGFGQGRGTAWFDDFNLIANPRNETPGAAKPLPSTDVRPSFYMSDYTGGFTSAAFSPDGKWLATGSVDKTVKIWDTEFWERTATFSGHTGGVTSVMFSPDGKRIASASSDRTIKIWNVKTGEWKYTLTGHADGVTSAAFSPNGNLLASASRDGTIKLWDATTGKEVFTVKGHSGAANCVSFSPDNQRLVSAGSDRTVKIWDARTGKNVFTLIGHAGAVTSVAYSPDGELIASGSEDRTVRLWNAPKRRHFLTLKAHMGEVLSVAFCANGKRLASVNGAVTVWDAPSWENSLAFTEWSAPPLCAAFSPNAKWLASAGGHLARIWDLRSRTTVRSADAKFGADSAATAPAEKNRSASVSLDRPAIEESKRYKAVEFTWPGGGISDLEFSPDGKRIAGCGFSNATVWDIRLQKQVHRFELGFGYVRGVTFSRDGKRIATTGNDSTIRVWDAATGKLILSFKTAGAVANTSVAFSPDGARLATATFLNLKSVPNVMVWDAGTGKACLALTGHENDVWKVAYSHDGKRLISAGSDGVRVWDAETGQQISIFAGPRHRQVFSVACSPNDQRIVYGEDGTVKVKILSGESGRERSFQGHSGVISDVAFSPNGKQVVSASDDKKVMLWDVGSDRPVLTYRGHGFGVTCVAFSPDGEWIASGDQGFVVRIWSARPDQRERVASERPSKR